MNEAIGMKEATMPQDVIDEIGEDGFEIAAALGLEVSQMPQDSEDFQPPEGWVRIIWKNDGEES